MSLTHRPPPCSGEGAYGFGLPPEVLEKHAGGPEVINMGRTPAIVKQIWRRPYGISGLALILSVQLSLTIVRYASSANA